MDPAVAFVDVYSSFSIVIGDRVDAQPTSQLNEDESLAILSTVGLTVRDHKLVKKLGGAQKMIASDLGQRLIAGLKFPSLRQWFDDFYRRGGFLLSLVNSPSSRLFLWSGGPLAFFGLGARSVAYAESVVAIVGSRTPSCEGSVATKNLARNFAEHDITVVSGGAWGVDQIAHRAALDHGGATIAIMGTVIKKAPPDFLNHERAAIIYPYGPFVTQRKFMFVTRNRYVANCANAVVIVQGKARSGTLHTAKFARAQKIPLYAVPGADNNPLSFVPNTLISRGHARVVDDGDELVRSIFGKRRRALKVMLKKIDEEPIVLRLLAEHHQMDLDSLVRITKIPAWDLHMELLSYELDGRVMRRGGQFLLTGS